MPNKLYDIAQGFSRLTARQIYLWYDFGDMQQDLSSNAKFPYMIWALSLCSIKWCGESFKNHSKEFTLSSHLYGFILIAYNWWLLNKCFPLLIYIALGIFSNSFCWVCCILWKDLPILFTLQAFSKKGINWSQLTINMNKDFSYIFISQDFIRMK